MPKIKRWFPVNHDINSDHELWQMTDKFGDRSIRVWLELLSIADRNEGAIPPLSDAFAKAIAFKCHTNAIKVRSVCDWAATAMWLVCDPTPRVRSYWKYHRTPEQRTVPSEPSEPSEPNRPLKKKNKRPPIVPQGGRQLEIVDFAFHKFWEAYPRKQKKQQAIEAWCKKAKHLTEVQKAIIEALSWQIRSDDWTRDGGRYIPYPATYLNQERWTDEKKVEAANGQQRIQPKGVDGLRQWAKIVTGQTQP